MRKTREVVIGRYINPQTYVLKKEDGSVFMTIREGEPFTIDNQMRSWVPVRVPNTRGYGTIMICEKYGDDGRIIGQFPLIHGRKGLWALTSGAARRGVFHSYTKPQNEIEVQLCKLGSSPKTLKKVDKIDMELDCGGLLCVHVDYPHGYAVYTDGNEERITQPKYIPMDWPNRLHRGCMESTYKARYSEATYLVHTHISTNEYGIINEHVMSVFITPNANTNEVVEVLKKIETKVW